MSDQTASNPTTVESPASPNLGQPADQSHATATSLRRKRLNPVKGFVNTVGGWFDRLAPSQAVVPAGTQQPSLVNVQTAQTIGELAVDANMTVAEIVSILAHATGDTAEVINSFDEDKEHPIGHLMMQVAILACYVLPPVMAYYAGSAIGATYSGGKPFNPFETITAFLYLVSWAYEYALVILMLAIVRQFKRVLNGGRKGVGTFITLVVLFLFLAVTSSAAQWVIFERRITLTDGAQVVGALFRTLGTPLVDTVCAVALAVFQVKSLDKHLADIDKKTNATVSINRKKVQSQLEIIDEAIQTKGRLQKEKDYQSKNELANTIIEMFSESAVETIRQALDSKRNEGSHSYRRDGYR